MSDDLIERDRRVCWHPYTQHGCEADPLPVARAEGAWLELADGRRVLDAISSWWATLHGHAEPRLVDAMATQAARLDHVLFAGATHEPAVQLAERVVEVAPGDLTRVFFSDDGSTAVEVALKMVLQGWVHRGEPERRVFLALEGAYHGDTFGAMAASDPEPFFVPFAPFGIEVHHIRHTVADLERALAEIGARLAGVIVEPLLQGAAGMRLVPAELLRAIDRRCRELDVPWIADEVMTGFGRTGAMFACQRAGVTPDLMCLAKGLTGGMLPLAATLTTEAIYAGYLRRERSGFFPHGHTFTANPIACAVGLASLALCRERDVPARFERQGAELHRQLADLGDHPRVRDLRCLGGMVAIEIEVSEDDRAGYGSRLAPWLRARAVAAGVLLRPLGNVLYALPPACLTDAEIRAIGDTMRDLVTAPVDS